MMLCKNMKAMVCWTDDVTVFFKIVTVVLKGDTLSPSRFTIFRDYILQMSTDIINENGFIQKEAGSRQYHTRTMSMIEYFCQIHLVKLNPYCIAWSKQQEALVSRRTWRKQSLHVLNIFTFSGRPLKLMDLFIYVGNNISSTESDVNIHLVKAWTAIGRLSIIWKSDLSNEIKWNLF